MHILLLVVIGLAVLAAFVLGARLLFGAERAGAGARAFIWTWLAASLVNGAVGVVHVGIPLLNEVGAFIAIFGIPAAAAWYLSQPRT